MKYAEAKQFLYADGSLRDVYVMKTSERDLNAFMNFVRPLIAHGDFHIGGEPFDLPATYMEVISSSPEMCAGLNIPVGVGTLNCHFFDSSELELDFRPSDYDDEEGWATASGFLQGLSDAMEREVRVTAENQPECVHIRYTPHSKEAEQVAASDGP